MSGGFRPALLDAHMLRLLRAGHILHPHVPGLTGREAVARLAPNVFSVLRRNALSFTERLGVLPGDYLAALAGHSAGWSAALPVAPQGRPIEVHLHLPGLTCEHSLMEDGAVHIAYLHVQPEQRARGLGRQFMARSLAQWRAMGMHQVTLSAGDTHGAYVWARYGFLPATDKEWSNLRFTIMGRIKRLMNYSYSIDPIWPELDTLLQEIDGQDARFLWQIADRTDVYGHPYNGQQTTLGRLILANGLSWSGRFGLADPSQNRRFQEYGRFASWQQAKIASGARLRNFDLW